ncbi:MAG TPA: DUF2079 domain-containing protein [Polyangiaceae bacterium]|nr:DUF2079 domain-containing protein [Polyangiaceae bacterium]
MTFLRARPRAGWGRGGADGPEARAARAFALLLLAGVSVGLCGGAVALVPDATLFWTKNTLGPDLRLRLIGALVASAAAFVVAGAWVHGRGGEAGLGRLERLAWLASPLGVLWAVPTLFDYRAWHATPLTYLVALAGVALALERTLRLSLAAFASLSAGLPRPELPALWRRRVPLALAVAAGAAYAGYFGYYTVLNHHRFGTSGFDLGIYDNLMFNATRGQPFRTTVLFGPAGGNNLASHAEFVVILFAPLYALFPRAETLLVLQSALLGFAAVPLYLFAATQLPRAAALVVAVVYLVYGPLHGPNFYDFHWLPTAIFFHFWLYYAIAARRTKLAIACVVVLYLIREDIAVGMALVGAFLLLSGARPRFGALLAATSVSWFVVDKFVIMPWAGKWWFANMYAELIPAGESGYGGVVKTLLTNPVYTLSTILRGEKVTYVLHLFAPLALLPARRVALLAVASSGALFTLLTTNYAPTLSISFQYTTHWIPYLFGVTVLNLRALGRAAGPVGQRAALGALAFAALSHSYVFGAILQRNVFVGGFGHIRFSMTSAERQRYRDFRELVANIPGDASVAATDRECPHVTARRTAYTLRDHHGDADYLLVAKETISYGGTRKNIEEAVSRNPYRLVGAKGGFFLFGRGEPTPETAPALAELGVKPKAKEAP